MDEIETPREAELRQSIERIAREWNQLILGIPNQPPSKITRSVRTAILAEDRQILALSREIGNAFERACW